MLRRRRLFSTTAAPTRAAAEMLV
eukprot:COSAG03_NODE_24986_length_268_cov_0.923077_1_plen_23_part_01